MDREERDDRKRERPHDSDWLTVTDLRKQKKGGGRKRESTEFMVSVCMFVYMLHVCMFVYMLHVMMYVHMYVCMFVYMLHVCMFV